MHTTTLTASSIDPTTAGACAAALVILAAWALSGGLSRLAGTLARMLFR